MALIQRSRKPTNYVLPVKIINGKKTFKTNFYYEDEKTLYKAYNQLLHIKSNFKPLHPIVY